MTLLSLLLSLFLVTDSVGKACLFISLVQDIPQRKRLWVLTREFIFALVIMFAFNYLGYVVLYLLDVDLATVQIAGGIVLFIIALRMVFPSVRNAGRPIAPGSLFVVPLATPVIAGPSLLAAIMIYTAQLDNSALMLSAIVLAWLVTIAVLLTTYRFRKALGKKGLQAVERLMGLVLTLIAVQRFLEGIATFTGELGI